MLPYISLCGLDISAYSLCMATAFLLCLTLFSRRMKILGYTFEQSTVIVSSLTLAALVGAYLLHQFIAKINQNAQSSNSGFVLYGGIITGFMCCFPICRLYKANVWGILDEIASIVPLGQAIGRIGCFITGCCYGKKTAGIPYVIYSRPSARAPQNVALIPVQLYEAIFDLLLFVFLFLIIKKRNALHLTSLLYLLCYSVFRFLIEFYRGDAARGVWGGLSTSQCISLMFLPLILFFFVKLRKNTKFNT